MKKSCRGFLLALVVLASCSMAAGDDAAPAGRLIEKRIKDLGPLPTFRELTVSHNGDHMACVLVQGAERTVFCDGKPGKTYVHARHHTSAPTFSPDGSHFAYRACNGETWHIVLDGKELPKCKGIRDADDDIYVRPSVSVPVFSPNSKQMAYVANIEGQWMLVLNGKPGRTAGTTSNRTELTFSPDSQRLAFTTEYLVVCDNRAGRTYQNTGPPIFSPNSAHIAHMARLDNEASIVCDGKDGPHYQICYGPVFAPDSRSLAYGAQVGQKWLIVYNGKHGRPYDDVGMPVFAPDSRQIAYYAKTGRKFLMVLNGEEDPPYDEARKPVFSADSKHLAYVAARDRKEFVVCDKQEGSAYHAINWHAFSANGKHIACLIQPGDSQYQAAMACDGLIGPTHAGIWVPTKFQARPDELRYVVADANRAWLVQVDWPTDRSWTDDLKPANP